MEAIGGSSRRGAGVLGASVAAVVAILLLAPAAASAATYRVDSIGDLPDASPGNNVCDVGNGFCTLRAVIMEANAHPGFDEIRFRSPMVDQEITIDPSVNGFYPSIDGRVKIDGCSSNPGRPIPCVGLQIDDGDGIPFLVSASDVTIKGLAIGNAFQAIQTDDTADDLTVRKNWFGLDINFAENPLEQVGVFVSADRARIGGGGGSAHRNVFANSSTGLKITKGDNTKVQGNWFGLEDDGSAIPNDENIEIVETGGDKPTGTLIGGTVTSSQAATTKCDGVCNVISAANGSSASENGDGIDLFGEFGDGEEAAGSTTIAGNFIGLDRFGGQDRGNKAGIDVGRADNVTIGGASSRDRNFIGGNDFAIGTFGSVDLLVVKRNWIGLSSSGDAAIPGGGVGTGGDTRFIRNRVVGDGTDFSPGFSSNFGAPVLKRNTFGIGPDGSDMGFGINAVVISGDGGTIGGPEPGDGNTIGNAALNGLVIGGSDNTVQGNYIGTDSTGNDRGNGSRGIGISSVSGDSADGNVIGGSGSAQNVISFNGSDAIEIRDSSSTGLGDNNEIKQNRGTGNGGIFIDLDPTNGPGVAPASMAPNNGITPPVIGTATGTKASGSGLPLGHKVRVYKTTSPGTGRIDRFLCADTAGTGGNWSCTYAASVPAGKLVTATRTDTTGNTSELAAFRTVPFP